MSKTVHSTLKPNQIEIDTIIAGSARILCHWGIHEVEIEDEAGLRTEYEYTEQVIKSWALDSVEYLTKDARGRQVLTDAGRAYFEEAAGEILKWAMAAAV